jgi:23S rRNA (uracil1939-C5)-methyltransferase
VARIAGKTVFIDGALPGEQVTFRYLKRRGGHDEGVATALLVVSPERVAPRCAHFGRCGGCAACNTWHPRPSCDIKRVC